MIFRCRVSAVLIQAHLSAEAIRPLLMQIMEHKVILAHFATLDMPLVHMRRPVRPRADASIGHNSTSLVGMRRERRQSKS